jgi:hypothetical protein
LRSVAGFLRTTHHRLVGGSDGRVVRIDPGILATVRHWRRYLAIALAVVLVLVVVRVVYVARHRQAPPGPGQIALTPGPVLITPASPVPTAVPTTLYVLSAQTLVKLKPSEIITIRAIQGLVNRDAPTIFILLTYGAVHDQDWLSVLTRTYKARVIDKPDSTRHIDQLSWYVKEFRSHFAGYVLFDAASAAAGGPSTDLAISLAGVLNAIPIDRNNSSLIQVAKSAGLKQLEDVSNRDYDWLMSSSYWPKFNRDAIYFNQPSGLQPGADYAVARRMAAFWDDVRNDPQMATMAKMLSSQRPGGIVFGWGYTDDQHREDIFVGMASRFTQSVLDPPPNLSVYMHYPLQQALKNLAPPARPTNTNAHYVAFLYSDGDNPKVIFNELTKPGNDRYASPFRGKIPIGWTLPPTIPELAGPVVNQIYVMATPADVFLSGPSGYGYAFPSLIPQKQIFAAQTQEAMVRLGLHDVLVLDTNGATGFTHAALDPLTAQPNVASVFFTAFNGVNQPRLGSVLWSNGKPVLPTATLDRKSGEGAGAMVARAASGLNSLPKDATSPAGYTVVYVDFWSVSMTDLHNLMSSLDPNVVVVRPDVLAAMAQANIRH